MGDEHQTGVNVQNPSITLNQLSAERAYQQFLCIPLRRLGLKVRIARICKEVLDDSMCHAIFDYVAGIASMYPFSRTPFQVSIPVEFPMSMAKYVTP